MAWDGLDDAELSVVHLLRGGDELRAFRAMRLGEPTPEDFESQFARGKPARHVQRRSTPVWMSVSMTHTPEATESRIRNFPRIGTHVAEVLLRGGEGFAFAETLEGAHISVWGDPFKLAKAVVDVYPVE